MPMFEYSCKSCGKEFEALVRTNSPAPSCPACQSSELEKLISTPAIKSDSTHGLAMRAAKKRDQKSGSEMARAQREYELHHND
ncbi:MAG: FmdB family zinc ribbon protein [Vicinamibacterales bacterium]|jgi:putative FmdB family regulatory protein